jgi:phosphohistidine phosphatase SixA
MSALGMGLEIEQAHDFGGGEHCGSFIGRGTIVFRGRQFYIGLAFRARLASFARTTLERGRSMLTMQSIRFAAVALAAALSLLVASEQSAPAQADWINALRQGGYVIVFRHGATHQDQADTDPLNPSNVAQQRQLNDAGRAKAKEIGEAFRKLKIPVGQIHASVFNRAVETGSLMNLGAVTPTLDLAEGGLVVTPIENNRRAQALRQVAATVPPAGTNILVVTHKPNILDAFGKDWFDVREGEASVFQPAGGGYKLIVRVQPDEWSKLAQAAPN